MLIKEFGGEFSLIRSVTRKAASHDVHTSVGDDCAVIRQGRKLLLVTQDSLVEGDHFSHDYFSPFDVGIKAMESNLSDIAAMGGSPTFAFVSISLQDDTHIEWVKDFYRGMHRSTNKYGVDIIGGDTTHSSGMFITITLMGEVSNKNLCLRSTARPGDIIKVTGSLGASTAGLKLLRNKIQGHDWPCAKHLRPRCRLDLVPHIAPQANAMADISDGLAADLGNIIQMSKVGAILDKAKIPIDKRVLKAAKLLGDDPYDYALRGGEDFELVYTVSPSRAERCPGKAVGEIVKGGRLMLRDGDRMTEISQTGYNHFG